jgi:hypothetical protein
MDSMLFLVILFVIIVYVAHSMYDPSDPFIMTGLLSVGIGFVALVYIVSNEKSENLIVLPRESPLVYPSSNVVSDGELSYNDQDYSDGPSISRNFIMDPIGQTDRNFSFENNEMDNADAVAQYVTGGAQTYIPSEVSSSNYYSVHDLAYPKRPGSEIGDARPELVFGSGSVVLNDNAISIDDKLTRGQQHRAEMNKRAIDGAVRATRDQFSKYFANELPENESREWWDGQADDMETDYIYNV